MQRPVVDAGDVRIRVGGLSEIPSGLSRIPGAPVLQSPIVGLVRLPATPEAAAQLTNPARASVGSRMTPAEADLSLRLSGLETAMARVHESVTGKPAGAEAPQSRLFRKISAAAVGAFTFLGVAQFFVGLSGWVSRLAKGGTWDDSQGGGEGGGTGGGGVGGGAGG